MTATSHAATGMLVGLLVGNTYVAVPIAILSHFAVDAIPHLAWSQKELFTKKFNIYLIIDLALAAIMAGAFVFFDATRSLHIVLCILGAVLPDAIWAYHNLFKKHLRGIEPAYGVVSRFHLNVQKTSDPKKKKQGASNELLWLAFLMLILLLITR